MQELSRERLLQHHDFPDTFHSEIDRYARPYRSITSLPYKWGLSARKDWPQRPEHWSEKPWVAHFRGDHIKLLRVMRRKIAAPCKMIVRRLIKNLHQIWLRLIMLTLPITFRYVESRGIHTQFSSSSGYLSLQNGGSSYRKLA